jgi:hypothetical protein
MCGLKMYDTSINEVWGVLGDPDDDEGDMPHLWRTKKDAEVYARRMYPDESPDKRYARIYFERILSYDDQYCADELEESDDTN